MKTAVALILAICVAVPGTASARRRHHKRSKPTSGKTSSDPTTEGRAYLKKANALAGEDNCEAAIKAYTAAHDMLGDPVILFNRAECYRRLGDKTNAIEDYRDFLEEVPAAPNRADIETKIAALAAPTAPAAPVRPTEPAAATQPPSAAAAAAARDDGGKVSPSSAAPKAAPVVEVEIEVGAGAEKPRTSTGSRFWLWTALAVAVAGGAAAAVFFLRPDGPMPPETTFGNFRF